MKILITGASGLIGGRLIKDLSSKGHSITSLTRDLKHVKILEKYGKAKIINWEKLDDPSIFQDYDIAILCSGPNSNYCENNRSYIIDNYINNTERFLVKLSKNKIKKIIYLSSIHVYNKPLEDEIAEHNISENNHPYAISKTESEKLILSKEIFKESKKYIFRLSNCYGYPVLTKADSYDLFINNICKMILEINKIEIKGNPNILKDFIPINYLTKIINYFIEHDIKSGIYNVSSGKITSLLSFAKKIQNRAKKLLDKKIDIITRSAPKTVNNYEISNAKIMKYIAKIQLNHDSEIDSLLDKDS